MSIFNTNPHKPFWSESLNKDFLMSKSSAELEKIGRKQNPPIELDRRKRKETLVDELYVVL